MDGQLSKDGDGETLTLNATCGPGAFYKNCMRVAWNMTRIGWAFFASISAVYFMVENPEDPKYLVTFLISLAIPPLIMFPMEYWSYKTMAPSGNYAESIFKLFGFPMPKYFDASPGTDWFKRANGGFFAINAAKAIEEHKARHRMWG